MTAKQAGQDFRVPTFEASWWIESEGVEFPKDQWRWRSLMMMPDFVGDAGVRSAAAQLSANDTNQPVTEVRFKRVRQGLCAQALHVGPYETESATIDRMKALMTERSLTASGPHHEVYLGDPRRSTPEKLRTILRRPVAQA